MRDDPTDPRHGSVNGYTNHGCRCERCRAAEARRQKRWRASVSLRPDDPQHGTNNGYTNYGCRCPRCSAAHKAYNRQYYQSRKNGEAGE